MTDEEIKKLLEDNLALTKETHEMVAKTSRYIKWLRVTDTIKVILIIVPLLAAALYLPSIVEFFTAGYGDLLPSGLLR